MDEIELLRRKVEDPTDMEMGMRSRNVSMGTSLQCNLDCLDCFTKEKRATRWASQETRNMPLDKVEWVAEWMKPMKLELVGPGETTLWKDGQNGFHDLITTFLDHSPETRILLMTNGTYVPPGDWINRINEANVSIDAPDRETFLATKGRDLFDHALSGLRQYMNSEIPKVTAKYVIRRTNIEAVPDFLRLISGLSQEFDRRGDDFRGYFVPVRPKSDESAPTHEQVEALKQNLGILVPRMDPDFIRQTNADQLYRFEEMDERSLQDPCYLLLTDASVGITGKIQGCQRKFGPPEYYIGHVFDSPEDIVRRRWDLFHVNPCYDGRKICAADYLQRSNETYRRVFGNHNLKA